MDYDFSFKMLKEYGTQGIVDAVEDVRGHCVWVDRDDIGDLLAVALQAAEAAQKLIDQLPDSDDDDDREIDPGDPIEGDRDDSGYDEPSNRE